MVYKKSIVKRVPLKKYRKRPMKKSKVPLSVKKYVKKALHVKAENKVANPVSASYSSIVPMTSATWGSIISASDVWALNQGTGQANRIANSVKPVSWIMKGALSLSATTVVEPCIIKMYVFKLLQGYQGPATGGATPSDFFQNGNTTLAPTNTIADIYRPVNTDKYKVYATRVFKLGNASNSLGTFANNDFSLYKMFNINLLKYQKSQLKFNDGATTPNNSGLYIAFVACKSNNTVIAADSIKITYDITCEFED